MISLVQVHPNHPGYRAIDRWLLISTTVCYYTEPGTLRHPLTSAGLP